MYRAFFFAGLLLLSACADEIPLQPMQPRTAAECAAGSSGIHTLAYSGCN